MPRGGKRPGAGAKPGNLNALKHGRNSKKLQQLVDALSSLPEARAALIAQRRVQQKEQRNARRLAVSLLALFFDDEKPSEDLLDRLENDQKLFGVSIQHFLSEIGKLKNIDQKPYLSPENDQTQPRHGYPDPLN